MIVMSIERLKSLLLSNIFDIKYNVYAPIKKIVKFSMIIERGEGSIL